MIKDKDLLDIQNKYYQYRKNNNLPLDNTINFQDIYYESMETLKSPINISEDEFSYNYEILSDITENEEDIDNLKLFKNNDNDNDDDSSDFNSNDKKYKYKKEKIFCKNNKIEKKKTRNINKKK